MTVWFTADTHFGHDKIRVYCKRPFASIEEHDEAFGRTMDVGVDRCSYRPISFEEVLAIMDARPARVRDYHPSLMEGEEWPASNCN